MDDTVGPAERLVAAARLARVSEADHDGHAYWALVREAAQEENGEPALRRGSGLLGSADALERKVGCDLVGSAADTHESLRSAAATALTAPAEVETETSVLSSLVCALGRTRDRRGVPVLVGLSGHEDADLRRQVASEFTFVTSGLSDGPDVRALIRLTRDEDPEVRDWAAFTLGFQREQDTTAIRDALWACTTDACDEVREEGARGLARRHDPRAVPLIARLLETDGWSHSFTLDAAEILGVPALLPALAACDPASPETHRAVAACDPVRRARLEDDAWTVVTELERLRPGIGAALDSPRYESVHAMRLTHREAADAGYDVAELLSRAGGDPARAAGLVVADLTRSPGGRSAT
ncbi:HEAT repeat domain-containing protein [Kitasatospora sp. NPDC059327]|uniref:HEAT repeat domain-containing protein n=1 Tax=Kitasatospora sp. NPDC059327 TaxID=3346803 RepID=UPI003696D197